MSWNEDHNGDANCDDNFSTVPLDGMVQKVVWFATSGSSVAMDGLVLLFP